MAAALPGRRGGGAEAPRLLLFRRAGPLRSALGAVSSSLCPLGSLLLALTATDGGRGPGSRPSGAGEGAEEAHSGRRSREPGTERPRPWRTPISSSTSSSATQVRPPAGRGGPRRAGGANGGGGAAGAGRAARSRAAPPFLPSSLCPLAAAPFPQCWR